MNWLLSHGFARRPRALADRHYNRQKRGTPQFVPPGRRLVLFAETGSGCAVWVTSWPIYAQHAWRGAWVNTTFRNEGAARSSDLIREAVAATRAHFGQSPELGMVTFVDPAAVRPKRDPGRCYLRAGFRAIACTRKRRLLVLHLDPKDMPAPVPAQCEQAELFA